MAQTACPASREIAEACSTMQALSRAVGSSRRARMRVTGYRPEASSRATTSATVQSSRPPTLREIVPLLPPLPQRALIVSAAAS